MVAEYAATALEQGAWGVLVGAAHDDIPTDRPLLVADDPLLALQHLAREVYQRVVERVDIPSGYMTSEQCDKLGRDTGFRDVVNLYGWPAGDNGSDSYAGQLYFPVSDDRSKVCTVDFWRNRVDSTKLEENVY